MDRSVQGTGVGGALLRDAMRRTAAFAEHIGIRVLAVQALDDDARGFYERRGFEATRTDPYLLTVLVKDIRAALEEP